MKKTVVAYVEPIDYFTEESRKEFKLGEYAENTENKTKKTDKEKNAKENKEFRNWVKNKR